MLSARRTRARRWRTGVPARAALLVALALVPLVGSNASPARAQRHPGFEPAQLATAYDVPALWKRGIAGQGQTIAFMEVDGVDPADLATFDRTFGLPRANPTVYVPPDATAALAPGPETTMDVEWAHALAPAAQLQVYEIIKAGDFANYSGHLAQMIAAAIGNGATVISISLRGTGSILCSTFWAARRLHPVFQNAAAHDIAVFAASGDYGYRPCQSRNTVGTVYPASDPYVTAVGGTRLYTSASGGYSREVAWSGSGGGYSSDFARPSWQRGPGDINGQYREVPDVAFDADPASGVLVHLQGGWAVEGGTSLGAPAWAALWALASQYHAARTGKRLGSANPLLYGLANTRSRGSVFHDVTAGDNGYWHARPGWDHVTGWGSPDATALVRALTP